jgi:hypothetical protein
MACASPRLQSFRFDRERVGPGLLGKQGVKLFPDGQGRGQPGPHFTCRARVDSRRPPELSPLIFEFGPGGTRGF